MNKVNQIYYKPINYYVLLFFNTPSYSREVYGPTKDAMDKLFHEICKQISHTKMEEYNRRGVHQDTYTTYYIVNVLVPLPVYLTILNHGL